MPQKEQLYVAHLIRRTEGVNDGDVERIPWHLRMQGAQSSALVCVHIRLCHGLPKPQANASFQQGKRWLRSGAMQAKQYRN